MMAKIKPFFFRMNVKKITSPSRRLIPSKQRESPIKSFCINLYQKENGGWDKNIDMAAMLTESEKASSVK